MPRRRTQKIGGLGCPCCHPKKEKVEVKPTMSRPALEEFEKAMELELQANDHKTGWINESFAFLEDRLDANVVDLHKVLDRGDTDAVKRQCCDVANFAMMIFDKISKEETEDGESAAP